MVVRSGEAPVASRQSAGGGTAEAPLGSQRVERVVRTKRIIRNGARSGFCALCVLCGLAGTAGAAVDDYVGKTVTSIRLVIEGRESTDAALTQVIETRVGTPLTMAAVRESLTHLFSLGRFDDVRVDAALAGSGVALLFELHPIHPVAKMVFEVNGSAAGIDVGRLRRALTDRYGPSPPLARAADMTRTIADLLAEDGYRHPAVGSRAELEHSPERATLVFTVDRGPRTTIGTVNVVGSPSVAPAQVLGELGVATGGPYEAAALTARIERYVASRRAQGHYQATVVQSVQFADNDRIAHVTLRVDPGPLVRVVFAGDPLPIERRAELVPIEREGSVDEDLLEDSSNRIEDALRAQGYRDASASHTREESKGELVITFTVRRGPLFQVERVEIAGNASVSLAEFQPALRLREGQPFSEARLDADIAIVEDLYRRRGFAAARAQAEVDIVAAATTSSQAVIAVRISIREGVRTLVGAIRIEGRAAVPEDSIRARLSLRPGAPYFEAQLRADADTVQSAYANLGYQNATIATAANFSADRTLADVVFIVQEGPRLVVDHILIVGNVRTRAETIQRELQLGPGDPLSPAAVNDSQRRLAALGLFRRIRISALRHGAETERDLLVTVEEAPPTTVGYGGGLEVRLRVVRRGEGGGIATETLEFAPRASFEIGRRNLFGRNRSANLFTSLSLHPSGTPEGGYGFPEYRVIAAFREPQVFNTSWDGFVTGTVEQQIRASFDFARRGANAEVARRLTPDVSVSGSYQIQRTQVFNSNIDPTGQLLVDRLFPEVRLSSFTSSATYDTRNDPLDPGHGEYASLSAQLAARRLGSQVGFVKTFMTAQVFRTPPRAARLVMAGSARLGLADVFAVDSLPASERFFGGGDTTVRGYALDTLATSQTKDQRGFPTGGNALVIFNAEARVPVWGGVGLVGFLDTGNVFARATDIDLGELKSAVGFGVRYKSPIGPIRVDLGFKLQRDVIAQLDPAGNLIANKRERLTALHISLGQAF